MTDTNALADQMERFAARWRKGIGKRGGYGRLIYELDTGTPGQVFLTIEMVEAGAAALRATDHHDEAEAYRNAKEAAEQRCAEKDAEIARLRKSIADQANSFNIAGSHYDEAITALDAMVHSVKRNARAALGEQP